MRTQRSNDIVDGETSRFGVGEDPGGEGAEPTIVFPRGMSLHRRGADERPDSALRFDDPGPLEFRIDPRDGIGVDLEIDRELADGGQLVTWTQAAGGNRGTQPAFKLGVNGCGVTLVDRNEAHMNYYTRQTVH